MNFSHSAFAPYQQHIKALGEATSLEALNAQAATLRVHVGSKPLRFFASTTPLSAAEYELGIADSGKVPSRENNLHDFLNALVWLRFPKLKSALNLRHCQELVSQPDERKQRGKLRDHLTLLDESGLLVVSSRPDLFELLRRKHWVELFWEARTAVKQAMQFFVVGHGLLEKCIAPYPGMTAKCLLLQAPECGPEMVDEMAASFVLNADNLEFPPLPIQGIPGWDENEYRNYYLNTSVFRPAHTPTQ